MSRDAAAHRRPHPALWPAIDVLAVTRRNLLHYLRSPRLLAFTAIQPIVFVLIFAYVFGGAIETPTDAYIDYLLPGILVQVVIFGSTQTGIGLAEDLNRGMIDRFRSLPIARSAVLAGRTLADATRNAFVVVLMTAVGVAIGFRPEGSPAALLGAFALAVLFGFAFSWISAVIGLLVRDAETAQVAGFVWIFPLVFVSSIFVPVETMPGALEAFAEVSPVTVTVDAIRALSLGTPVGDAWWQAVAWMAAIVGAFFPLAVRMYRRIP